MSADAAALERLADLSVRESFLYLANVACYALPKNVKTWSAGDIKLDKIERHAFTPDVVDVIGAEFEIADGSTEVVTNKTRSAHVENPFTIGIRDEFARGLFAALADLKPGLDRRDEPARKAVERIFALLPNVDDELDEPIVVIEQAVVPATERGFTVLDHRPVPRPSLLFPASN